MRYNCGFSVEERERAFPTYQWCHSEHEIRLASHYYVHRAGSLQSKSATEMRRSSTSMAGWQAINAQCNLLFKIYKNCSSQFHDGEIVLIFFFLQLDCFVITCVPQNPNPSLAHCRWKSREAVTTNCEKLVLHQMRNLTWILLFSS